jgi:hypothetical protein
MSQVPEASLLPDQLPEAIQLSALLLVQLSVVEPLYSTFEGLADKFTVGASGALTEVFTSSLTVSSGSLSALSQDRLELLLVASKVLIPVEPELEVDNGLPPDPAPEAVQSLPDFDPDCDVESSLLSANPQPVRTNRTIK